MHPRNCNRLELTEWTHFHKQSLQSFTRNSPRRYKWGKQAFNSEKQNIGQSLSQHSLIELWLHNFFLPTMLPQLICCGADGSWHIICTGFQHRLMTGLDQQLNFKAKAWSAPVVATHVILAWYGIAWCKPCTTARLGHQFGCQAYVHSSAYACGQSLQQGKLEEACAQTHIGSRCSYGRSMALRQTLCVR